MLPILLLLASPLSGPALDPPPLVRSHQDDRRAREERKVLRYFMWVVGSGLGRY